MEKEANVWKNEEEIKGEPVQFIKVGKDKRFSITPEAVELLESLKGRPLGVISIVGKYRTGKSFIANRVLLN